MKNEIANLLIARDRLCAAFGLATRVLIELNVFKAEVNNEISECKDLNDVRNDEEDKIN